MLIDSSLGRMTNQFNLKLFIKWCFDKLAVRLGKKRAITEEN